MVPKIVKSFPDEFLLECRVLMDADEFEEWFEAQTCFGYIEVTAAANNKIKTICCEGKHYLMLSSASTPDYVFLGNHIYHLERVTPDQIKLLLKGKVRIVLKQFNIFFEDVE